MRIAQLMLAGVLWLFNSAAAQSGGMIVTHSLPDDLQSSLEGRFTAFVEAQAAGRWGEVADLLGRCRLGCNRGNLYTSSYKECLVSRMQEVQMLDFDFSTQHLATFAKTEDEMGQVGGMVNRLAAEQSLWYVTGTGRFRTSSEDWSEQTRVIAYRDQGQWYFTPPQWRMQDKWEKAHYTEADFGRDRRDEIEVRNTSLSPVEITIVHVYMDKQDPSSRNVTFRLRNKTSKKVTSLSLSIGDDSGEVAFGARDIEPKGYVTAEQDFSAYVDFCDGVATQAFVIHDVDFADGSKWVLKKPTNQNDK